MSYAAKEFATVARYAIAQLRNGTESLAHGPINSARTIHCSALRAPVIYWAPGTRYENGAATLLIHALRACAGAAGFRLLSQAKRRREAPYGA